jgi:hypothetical protein
MSAEELGAALRGDFATSARKRRDVDSWSQSLLITWRQLRDALVKVQADQPTLFNMLQLPQSVVEAIRRV